MPTYIDNESESHNFEGTQQSRSRISINLKKHCNYDEVLWNRIWKYAKQCFFLHTLPFESCDTFFMIVAKCPNVCSLLLVELCYRAVCPTRRISCWSISRGKGALPPCHLTAHIANLVLPASLRYFFVFCFFGHLALTASSESFGGVHRWN